MAVEDTDVKVSELTDAVSAIIEKLINNVQLLQDEVSSNRMKIFGIGIVLQSGPNRCIRDGTDESKRGVCFCRGPDFRPKFQPLGELTRLHPDIAHFTLTAKAKPKSITALAET